MIRKFGGEPVETRCGRGKRPPLGRPQGGAVGENARRDLKRNGGEVERLKKNPQRGLESGRKKGSTM